jgi:hypothetical protein
MSNGSNTPFPPKQPVIVKCNLCGVIYSDMSTGDPTIKLMIIHHTNDEWAAYQSANGLSKNFPHWNPVNAEQAPVFGTTAHKEFLKKQRASLAAAAEAIQRSELRK